MNRQNTVLELGLDSLCVRIVGQGEAANEAAVGAFNAMVAFVFLFEFALPGNGEYSILYRHFDVFFLYRRQFGFDDVLLVVFGDIGNGRPVGEGEAFASITLTRSAAKNV